MTIPKDFGGKHETLYLYPSLREGDFGSDVEGIKPICFYVGTDETKLEEALVHCREHLGDNVTLLLHGPIPYSMKEIVKKRGKEAGPHLRPWDCYNAENFYGWEAERVVAVTSGANIMEVITRARTHLAVIFVAGGEGEGTMVELDTKNYFMDAERLGLVDEIVDKVATSSWAKFSTQPMARAVTTLSMYWSLSQWHRPSTTLSLWILAS